MNISLNPGKKMPPTSPRQPVAAARPCGCDLNFDFAFNCNLPCYVVDQHPTLSRANSQSGPHHVCKYCRQQIAQGQVSRPQSPSAADLPFLSKLSSKLSWKEQPDIIPPETAHPAAASTDSSPSSGAKLPESPTPSLGTVFWKSRGGVPKPEVEAPRGPYVNDLFQRQPEKEPEPEEQGEPERGFFFWKSKPKQEPISVEPYTPIHESFKKGSAAENVAEDSSRCKVPEVFPSSANEEENDRSAGVCSPLSMGQFWQNDEENADAEVEAIRNDVLNKGDNEYGNGQIATLYINGRPIHSPIEELAGLLAVLSKDCVESIDKAVTIFNNQIDGQKACGHPACSDLVGHMQKPCKMKMNECGDKVETLVLGPDDEKNGSLIDDDSFHSDSSGDSRDDYEGTRGEETIELTTSQTGLQLKMGNRSSKSKDDRMCVEMVPGQDGTVTIRLSGRRLNAYEKDPGGKNICFGRANYAL